MHNPLPYLLLGILAGAFSGLIGIGGGVAIVPVLVLYFGLSQHMAQGTTLAAMIPPIGILAAYVYYQNGYVDIKIAVLIAAGFLIGGAMGAKFAIGIDRILLERLFGLFSILIGVKMLLSD